ncbi:MAG: cupin domain-containing protein [Acidimicrobiia bacterium]|nr:cupin domain-containing protein [Acidimicrobiia bacterium]MDH4307150.1 cupin domain-containing protein [Acidimicrobiia bacterium]MDH5293950.1 cupin domain-containing protein [Acidimicrobiia bacterium]
MAGQIRVVKGSTPIAWGEIPQDADDPRPPAYETIEHRSADGRFAVGFWKRDPEEGAMELTEFHEVMFILEGEIEITSEDGTVNRVGPGDMVIAPQDSRGTWKALSPVKKVWAIYRETT